MEISRGYSEPLSGNISNAFKLFLICDLTMDDGYNACIYSCYSQFRDAKFTIVSIMDDYRAFIAILDMGVIIMNL